MKKLLLLTLLSMSFVLSACAPKSMRMVDAKDEVAFVTMYHAMKPAMLKNELVDSKGNWYAPLISTEPEHVGHALLDRLSPKFCCAYLSEPPVKSFRAMTTPEDAVRVGPWSTSLRTQDYAVKLQLAAVTDWNDDGKDDWLVSCRVTLAASPDESREYFLLIANFESPVLDPFVLMERRHMFRRISVLSDNSLSRFAGTVTVEVEQGQIDVTQAPGRVKHKFDDSNLKSSMLSH